MLKIHTDIYHLLPELETKAVSGHECTELQCKLIYISESTIIKSQYMIMGSVLWWPNLQTHFIAYNGRFLFSKALFLKVNDAIGNLIFIVNSHNILAFADSEKDGKGDIEYHKSFKPIEEKKPKKTLWLLFFYQCDLKGSDLWYLNS